MIQKCPASGSPNISQPHQLVSNSFCHLNLKRAVRSCRLIIDAPQSGAENMAIDQAILTASGDASEGAGRSPGGRGIQPTLRIYRWASPTVSLGYFQSIAERRLHPPSENCACVRRQSGGGAIVHHHELTYSLVLPVSDRWSAAANDLYQSVHRALVDWYQELGAPATLAKDGDQTPFLCFQRRSQGDILIENHKVTGSAQRRHRGALLQHGSILLGKSDFAPELPGLLELGADSQDIQLNAPQKLAERVAACIADSLRLKLTEGQLSDFEEELASRSLAGRFENTDWTHRR